MKQKPFEVALDLPIKTYDIDFAGIVSNIVYIRWLEDLRLKIL
jgi:acyl-CoA thioester hydrolase